MKKHYYNLTLCIIGISVLIVALILFTALIFILKEFTIVDIFKYTIAIIGLILCINSIFAYVAFGDDYLVYKKGVIAKQKFIDYIFFDKVIIDFEAVLGQDAYIYFKKNDKIVLSYEAKLEIVKDIVNNINKKKIEVIFNINSKWYNMPKKYHKLLFPYLSPKDKKSFLQKYGEEYSKNLND
ncbi:MAG: hypothetical protein IJF75_07445 [Clostridia bacterium]|nr:hypothetical protein [Clostridia bacterium]